MRELSASPLVFTKLCGGMLVKTAVTVKTVHKKVVLHLLFGRSFSIYICIKFYLKINNNELSPLII